MEFWKEGGWWLPKGETHLKDWMLKHDQPYQGRLSYQITKFFYALQWCNVSHTRAIDIGAHVGLWSYPMIHTFPYLVAFEPVQLHAECWRKNIWGDPTKLNFNPHFAELHEYALGAASGVAHMLKNRTNGSSGDTFVEPNPDPDSAPCYESVVMKALDEFNYTDVDFIKIDCEGYELFVLQGARETLIRNRPCVLVEQKPETGMTQRYGVTPNDVHAFMTALGAKRRFIMAGDFCYSWD
jgi:FkbM family methyltransferase